MMTRVCTRWFYCVQQKKPSRTETEFKGLEESRSVAVIFSHVSPYMLQHRPAHIRCSQSSWLSNLYYYDYAGLCTQGGFEGCARTPLFSTSRGYLVSENKLLSLTQ